LLSFAVASGALTNHHDEIVQPVHDDRSVSQCASPTQWSILPQGKKKPYVVD